MGMDGKPRLLAARVRVSIVLALGVLLSFLQSPADAATRVPTVDGRGTVTTEVSPAHTPAEIVATPVPHAGGGVVTTRTGPTVSAPTEKTSRRRARLSAPLASAPSFTISANCTADANGTITITNVGGDMTVPFTWRLSLNGTPIAEDPFQLNASQSTSIRTAGLFGTLTLDVLDPSGAIVASSSMYCQTPPPPPAPSFTISASCTADASGTFTIANVGGDMTVPFTWRLSLNGTPIASGSFQLNGSQSTSIRTAGLFGTLTLDVLDATNTVVASGSTFCQSPSPPTAPSFTVVAACTADASGTITITDTGGDMTVPFTWRLSLNGTPIASQTFQINAGQSTTVRTAGLFGTLTLDVLDPSNAVVASGSTFCPTPPPPAPPAFAINASCASDATGIMTIADIGGDMTVPFTWRLSLNGTPIASQSFEIKAGQSTSIHTAGLFGTLALEVLDATDSVLASGAMFCPGQVSVPSVIGLTQAAATSAITGAGLAVGTVTMAGSSTVPSGSVISQTPIAGTQVAAGSAVNLVVSSGALLGDVNGDGVVDCTDLAIVRASFGKKSGQPGFDARADVNLDGVVNIVDLSTVARALPAGTVCK